MGSLGGLYRVASLVGLAVSLSLPIQKYPEYAQRAEVFARILARSGWPGLLDRIRTRAAAIRKEG